MAFLDFFKRKKLQPASPTRGGWFPLVKEPWAGAWQQNRELTRDEMLTQHAVYSCISLVANDISKLEIDLKRRDENGIYVRVDDHPVFGPDRTPLGAATARKPNSNFGSLRTK